MGLSLLLPVTVSKQSSSTVTGIRIYRPKQYYANKYMYIYNRFAAFHEVGVLGATECWAADTLHRGCRFGLWPTGMALQRITKSPGAVQTCHESPGREGEQSFCHARSGSSCRMKLVGQ